MLQLDQLTSRGDRDGLALPKKLKSIAGRAAPVPAIYRGRLMAIPDLKDLGFLGGALSALVAAVSYWAKTRHERKRATRTILYHLLELHHVVHRVTGASTILEGELIQQVRAELASRGLTLDESQARSALQEAAPVLRAFGRNELAQAATSVGLAFSNALADLAREDPVLAFRLRGRERLLLLPDAIEAASQNQVRDVSTQGDAQMLHDVLLRMSLDDLRAAIRATAWRCDVVTHVRTLLLIRKAECEEESEELKALAARVVHEFIARCTISAQVPSR